MIIFRTNTLDITSIVEKEIGYRLPSSELFALGIFKRSKSEDRKVIREQISTNDTQSQLATQWLPNNFKSKRINVFGKDNFKECDSIAIVNYGFNGKDGHINEMFRSLTKENQKDIHIVHYNSYNSTSISS